MSVGRIVLIVSVMIYGISGLTISFSGNVSAAESNSDWSYRSTSIGSFDLPDIASGAYWSSLAVDASNKTVSGSSIWGAMWAIDEGYPVGYFACWNVGVTFGPGTNFLDIDVSGSEGFLAYAYYALVEKDTTGKVVSTTSLQQGILSGIKWAVTQSSNGNLKWATFTASTGAQWTISITYVVSNIIGQVDYGNATVTPKAVESVIAISNWPYQSASNTLSLVIGVATGAAQIQGNLLKTGNSSSQVYFSVSNTAIIDGSTKNLVATGYTSGDFDTYIGSDYISTLFSSVYSGSGSVYVATVTFTPNANNIVYDPTSGSGTPYVPPPPPVTNTSSNIVANLVLFITLYIVALF